MSIRAAFHAVRASREADAALHAHQARAEQSGTHTETPTYTRLNRAANEAAAAQPKVIRWLRG